MAAPQAVPVEAANAAAEALGVEPDMMEVPPGIVRGVFVFELEDGSFGYQSMNEGPIDIMDAITLGNRLVEGARADLIVVKLNAYIERAKQAKAAAQQKPTSRILTPRVMGRRP